jgi:hypothetical protein
MDNDEQVTGSDAQDRRGLSRRDFLAQTALIGAVLPVGSVAWAASPDQPAQIKNRSDRERGNNQMKTRKLGNLEVSELGPVRA